MHSCCKVKNNVTIEVNVRSDSFFHPVYLPLEWPLWGLKVHQRLQSCSSGHGSNKISPQTSQIEQSVETSLEVLCSHVASCLCQTHTIKRTHLLF